MDIFETKNISPMLIGKNQPAFDSPDYIFELKFDGVRALAYIDKGAGVTELRNKRNKRINPVYPELMTIHQQVKKTCILDGEIAVLINGKPDFFAVQARSLMSNPFKIELAMKKTPVCFIAFDILYYDGEQITGSPLMERKALLRELVEDSSLLAVSRWIEEKGIALFELTKEQQLEGIVAKRKESLYRIGKTTKDWIKCKALLDEDFFICGYYFKAENLVSVILGSLVNNQMVYQGHVVMGSSRLDFQLIKKTKQTDAAYYAGFPSFDGAVWLEPVLVCNVEYTKRTENGSLHQAVFRGLRLD